MNNKINKFICLFLALGLILITITISILLANHEISTIEYFFETKALKKENYSASIETLKQIADDKNISLVTRNAAVVKALEIVSISSLEVKIEATLQAASYKYVICNIDTKIVRIILKPDFIFTRSKVEYIKKTVTDLTSIKNAELTIKR